MAVKIRLTRMGRKRRPFYRIIVADARSPRDGRFIEIVGTYNPVIDPPEVMIKDERINYWLDQGAQPSDTVRNILQSQGIMHRRAMVKRGLDEKAIEEEMKKWEVLQLDKLKRKEAQATQKKKNVVKAPEKDETASEKPAEADVVNKEEQPIETSVSEAPDQPEEITPVDEAAEAESAESKEETGEAPVPEPAETEEESKEEEKE